MTARAAVLGVVLWIVVAVAPARARADDAAATARKALIVLRVLAYDRALPTRAPADDITVLVVHPPTAEGRAERDRWLSGFAMIPNVRVGGRAVHARALEVGTDKALAAATVAPALVIVAAGVPSLASLQAWTRSRHALSFSLREDDVRAGVAIGLRDGEQGNEILVNLDAARAEGVRFTAGFLQIAKLVDEDRP